MRTPPSRFAAAAVALSGAVALSAVSVVVYDGSGALQAQERTEVAEIASTEVAVSRDEATLLVELIDGDELDIRLEDGRALVDGEDVGAFGPELGAAWRELLGRVIALENGPLARALVDWEPPLGSDGSADELGERLDQALEEALVRETVTVREMPRTPTSVAETLGRLLGRTDRLAGLALALDDLNVDELSLHIGEDVVVGADEFVDGTLLVIDGDVEVAGEVGEHVVVVGGTLRTLEGSEIGGDVRVTEGRLERDGGHVAGVVRTLDPSSMESEIRAEVEAGLRDAREARRVVRDDGVVRVVMEPEDDGFMAPLRVFGRNIVAGVTGVVETFVSLVILSILGGLTLMFGRKNLEVVAETARRSPGRSAVVGLAGAFLTVPVWLLGLVALCISIIGIPVALAWIPLFPLAVVLAAAMGYFAVAQNTGEWVARRRLPYLDWVRSSNPYTLVVGGLTVLLAAFFVASVVRIFGLWIGPLQGLLIATGVVVTTAAALVGFGAVLLTRAGRRPEYYTGSDPLDEPWDWDPTPPAPGPTTGPAGTAGPSGQDASATTTAADAGTDDASAEKQDHDDA